MTTLTQSELDDMRAAWRTICNGNRIPFGVERLTELAARSIADVPRLLDHIAQLTEENALSRAKIEKMICEKEGAVCIENYYDLLKEFGIPCVTHTPGCDYFISPFDALVAWKREAEARIAELEAHPSAQLWHPMTSEPYIGRKFIALYNDGSGAVMFWRHDGGLIDQDGDEAAFPPQGFDCWAYLPGELEFLCETRGEDPMKLTCTQSTAAQPSAQPNDNNVERVARIIREEIVRQYRDDERGKCPAGRTFYEEQISPELIAVEAIKAMRAPQPSAQFVAGKLEGLRRAAEICKEQSQKFLEKAGWVRDSDGNFYRVLSAHNTESNAFVSKSNGAGCIRAAILAEAALKGEGK